MSGQQQYSATTAPTETAGAGQPQDQSIVASILPLVLIMGIFYLLILRPQQKRYRRHQEMVKSVTKGDKVLTAGGVIGKVTKVDESQDTVHIQIADSVTIEVSRPTLATVYKEGEEPDNKQGAGKKGQSKSKKSIANDN